MEQTNNFDFFFSLFCCISVWAFPSFSLFLIYFILSRSIDRVYRLDSLSFLCWQNAIIRSFNTRLNVVWLSEPTCIGCQWNVYSVFRYIFLPFNIQLHFFRSFIFSLSLRCSKYFLVNTFILLHISLLATFKSFQWCTRTKK